jgi:hypothetical protein
MKSDEIFICWFCILLLQGLLLESSGSFKYRIISAANRDNLSSFSICIFYFFSCLIALAKNSSTVFFFFFFFF